MSVVRSDNDSLCSPSQSSSMAAGANNTSDPLALSLAVLRCSSCR
jgi:hypothetical protein